MTYLRLCIVDFQLVDFLYGTRLRRMHNILYAWRKSFLFSIPASSSQQDVTKAIHHRRISSASAHWLVAEWVPITKGTLIDRQLLNLILRQYSKLHLLAGPVYCISFPNELVKSECVSIFLFRKLKYWWYLLCRSDTTDHSFISIKIILKNQ